MNSTEALPDYREAGFGNRIPFDLYSLVVDRGVVDNEDAFRLWCIENEDVLFDAIIGPAVDRVEDLAREELGWTQE